MNKAEFEKQIDLISKYYEEGKQAVYNTAGPLISSEVITEQNAILHNIRALRDIAAATTRALYEQSSGTFTVKILAKDQKDEWYVAGSFHEHEHDTEFPSLNDAKQAIAQAKYPGRYSIQTIIDKP